MTQTHKRIFESSLTIKEIRQHFDIPLTILREAKTQMGQHTEYVIEGPIDQKEAINDFLERFATEE
jgi:hypothetical protein